MTPFVKLGNVWFNTNQIAYIYSSLSGDGAYIGFGRMHGNGEWIERFVKGHCADAVIDAIDDALADDADVQNQITKYTT